MADALSVAVPEDNENGNNTVVNNEQNGLSLNENFENDEEERNRAGLNSPKGDPSLAAPEEEIDGGSTPNTLRNQYGVNSPRKKGEIPGGWGAANQDGSKAEAGAAPSGGGGGVESLVTQVSQDDPMAQIVTQVPRDDSSLNTEQQLQTHTNAQSGGFCACLTNIFQCCSKPNVDTNNSTQQGSGSGSSTIAKSKPQDPLIPASKKKEGGSGSGGGAGGSGGGDDEKEESYTETEYPPGLLPPLLPEHVGQKCLVLDLDETLVHSSFKPIPNPDFIIPVEIDNVVHRVYVMKRPYVDEFLIECAKDYEVVVFTASLAKYADPLLDKLDPHNTITHRLFRESCVLHGTAYVKDLRTLGRKLRDSIIIDNSPPSYLFQPINAVPILSWFDDQTDTQLRDLLPCLQTTLKNIKDVRKVLDANTKSYRWLCQQANKPLEIFE